MRKIREALRLSQSTGRAIGWSPARLWSVARRSPSVFRHAAVIGITSPIPEKLDDTAPERKLFAPTGHNAPRSKPLPDWGHVHTDLPRPGQTLALLCEEYRGDHFGGCGQRRFCDLCRTRHGIAATVARSAPCGCAQLPGREAEGARLRQLA